MLEKTKKVRHKQLRMRVLNIVVASIYIQRFERTLTPREKVTSMRNGNKVVFGSVNQQHRARYSVNFCRIAKSIDGFLCGYKLCFRSNADDTGERALQNYTTDNFIGSQLDRRP